MYAIPLHMYQTDTSGSSRSLSVHSSAVQEQNIGSSCLWVTPHTTSKCGQFYCLCSEKCKRDLPDLLLCIKVWVSCMQFHCMFNKQPLWGLPDLFLCIAVLCRRRMYVVVVDGIHLALLSNVRNSIASVIDIQTGSSRSFSVHQSVGSKLCNSIACVISRRIGVFQISFCA